MYAVIEACGRQYKVAEGDLVFVQKLEANEGEKVTFDQVLLISDDGKVKIGNPTVKNAKVEATVVKQGKEKKIVVYKYKAKKNERKMRGHRQPYTKIQIEKIAATAAKAKKEEAEVEEKVEKKTTTKKATTAKKETKKEETK